MSANHPNPVCQAFDVIHDEMRRLQRENAELRKQVNQKEAAIGILTDRNKDLERHATQLRGALARKFEAGGVDLTGIVRVVA